MNEYLTSDENRLPAIRKVGANHLQGSADVLAGRASRRACSAWSNREQIAQIWWGAWDQIRILEPASSSIATDPRGCEVFWPAVRILFVLRGHSAPPVGAPGQPVSGHV